MIGRSTLSYAAPQEERGSDDDRRYDEPPTPLEEWEIPDPVQGIGDAKQ